MAETPRSSSSSSSGDAVNDTMRDIATIDWQSALGEVPFKDSVDGVPLWIGFPVSRRGLYDDWLTEDERDGFVRVCAFSDKGNAWRAMREAAKKLSTLRADDREYARRRMEAIVEYEFQEKKLDECGAAIWTSPPASETGASAMGENKNENENKNDEKSAAGAVFCEYPWLRVEWPDDWEDPGPGVWAYWSVADIQNELDKCKAADAERQAVMFSTLEWAKSGDTGKRGWRPWPM